MKVSEAIEQLSGLDPDADLMIDGSRGTGNLADVFCMWSDEYGFFGKPVPCVILSDRTKGERYKELAELRKEYLLRGQQ